MGGDSLYHDVGGANRLGLYSVHFTQISNPGDPAHRDAIVPRASVSSHTLLRAAMMPLLDAALKTLGEQAGLIAFPDREPAPLAAQRLLASLAPTHLVAVETPGRGKDGDYRSARGRSIASWNTPLDELFIHRPPRVVSVGIGDGGNEIGMGNVRPRLLRLGPRARKIASVVTVDHLVVAGTANWGAYGVVAHLSILSGQNLLHTGEEERRLIAACVEAGGVDGLTRRPEPTVDGLPAEMHAAMVELLRSLVEGARSSDGSTGGQQS